MIKKYVLITAFMLCCFYIQSQTVTIDASQTGRKQVIDGFGTCLSGTSGESTWMQQLYYDDAWCSILRMDLVPRFISPYSDNSYNSPWFHNNPPLPGPDKNNVRTYTNASDYSRSFNDNKAQIAVMGSDISKNIRKFNYDQEIPRVAGEMAIAGSSRRMKLGDFKLIASIWSPAPWLKIPSGNIYKDFYWYPGPYTGTKYPFIWVDNFVGGKLDISDVPRTEFFDGVQNTSALTQFARSTAAYIKGFQDKFGVAFYAISIQNELNFETFYNSCTYPLASQYIAALKAVRKEFDKYNDLKDIKIMGPEDLLGSDIYGLWQYGQAQATSADPVVHKNLQYLSEIEKDAAATAAIDFYCIHGYAADGMSSAGSNATLWDLWANGWTGSPAPGIPAQVKGFKAYNKKSWMTETSGEICEWLAPASEFPNNGGFGIALKIQQALTNGNESAWIYWQLTDGKETDKATLTDSIKLQNSPKYIAFKHFSRYIRPNAVRLNTSVLNSNSILASSYIHDVDQSLCIVLVNSDSAAHDVTINVPDLPFPINSFDVYTSSNNNYWQLTQPNVNQKKLNISIPEYGISTLYVKNSTSGLGSDLADITLSIYPNPTTKNLTVRADHLLKSLTIRSTTGQVIAAYTHIKDESYTIHTDNIDPGIYLIEIKTMDDRSMIKKIVIL